MTALLSLLLILVLTKLVVWLLLDQDTEDEDMPVIEKAKGVFVVQCDLCGETSPSGSSYPGAIDAAKDAGFVSSTVLKTAEHHLGMPRRTRTFRAQWECPDCQGH